MLNGTWIAQAAEFGGQSLPVPETVWRITGDRYVVNGPRGREEGRLQIDVTVTPHTVDLVGTSGPSAGRTIPALFRLRGQLLQICYVVGDEGTVQPRPHEFSAAPGSMQLMVRYRRQVTD
jgi:uncharacterized protein (TIGR03067 family)